MAGQKKSATATGKKKAKGYIDFKRFVNDCFMSEGNDSLDELKLKRKVIVGFYAKCVGETLDRKDIEKYLRHKGYGSGNQVLDDKHFQTLEDIRSLVNQNICDAKRY